VTESATALAAALPAAVAAALLSAGLMLFGVRPVLAGLPEPADAPADKVPYAAVAGRAFVATCSVLAAVAVGFSWTQVGAPVRPLWVVLGTVALLLAAIDARTTWLPLPLTRVAWLAMAAAVLTAGIVAALTADTGSAAAVVLRSLAGAGLSGLLYLGIWWGTRGGFGFGDVRFAPLVGAAAAAQSLSTLLWALALGSLVGGVHGLIRLARRRPGQFPYAPAMLAGAYLALAVRPLTG
jgi:leader peptidase (prepilin peptidase) / N-methyltransferase